MRIGFGYDIHRLTENRRLILGGVEIPFDKGLLGHSDADVLLHAITDAILGAASLGDIGRHFPDTDPKFKDADSRVLLREAYGLIRKKGFKVGNIDALVISERPKIGPYSDEIRRNISEDLDIDADTINIKATTNEKLGPIGREEAIAAQAVCLLEKE